MRLIHAERRTRNRIERGPAIRLKRTETRQRRDRVRLEHRSGVLVRPCLLIRHHLAARSRVINRSQKTGCVGARGDTVVNASRHAKQALSGAVTGLIRRAARVRSRRAAGTARQRRRGDRTT